MKTIVSFGSRRKAPFGRLALFIWATSLLLTAVLTVLTAWMAVEQSDPLSVMLAILAVVCLVVGREAWRFTWTK
jgi:hypothetical protein